MDDPARLLRTGARRLRTGALDAAVKDLQRAVEIDPERRRGFLLLGLAHERRGEEELARAAYREAGQEPGHADREAVEPAPDPTTALKLPVIDPEPRALRLIEDGLLVASADTGCLTRLRHPVLMTGQVEFEPVGRVVRGVGVDESSENDGGPLCRLTGSGILVLSPAGGRFTLLESCGGCYLREDRLEALDGTLAFENGRIPGRDAHIPVFRVRGRGSAVVRTLAPPLLFPVRRGRRVQVVADALLGWLGEVVPYLHPGDAEQPPTLICDGEGALLVEPPRFETVAAEP